ncbi:tRNA (5-methylaminomethyl-2-thiouridine)(34)-methyltransferase MnmD [Xylophilus rhododendri]|uniref:tRNA 5-methylaminomethyl-2-thiouridine biosynthesis bifunctional protein MnmC n=1 Tax=Xylophilus rhododendri TaxID=2697032 RepID=A0A857IYF0_9BURK|nr:tRNA (5-methylaminomethyl-2-thiouridine)(34)-methyltransferase MnmD [Xylophilus rhododendri]QHI96580.1 tRNA (5-methylaminomethyl-2-thiouridine)(34)-methyltransferase MnmD [Xylophilus rhododendri]
MAEPVEWRADGTPFSTPYSPRFQDRYRSELGGLDQARDVFLAGCGLPAAWQGTARWCILETGFGLGLNFLTAWQAWREDPRRPAMLHYVATEAYPADASDVRRNAQAHPHLQPLADELADGWWGLEPGTHRIALDGGRVQLTLLIGDSTQALRGLGRFADSVFLDGFSPDRNPEMWSGDAMRAVARCCRRDARLATWTVARLVRDGLASAGFQVAKVEGVAPKRHNLQARLVHLPARHVDEAAVTIGDCTVIGAGLAGAAVARAMALRGWRVRVLEAGPGPASGASGVPAGLFAPHVSADDAVLSRLSRAGVRALVTTARGLLQRGVDWDLSGVSQQREGAEALWHEKAGWLRPARLVRALLDTPGITVEYGRTALPSDREFDGPVILAAGSGSLALLPAGFPLQPVAGQISFGPAGALAQAPAAPLTPMNGHGHFMPLLPLATGTAWLAGASFERDVAAVEIPDEERLRHRMANRQRLAELAPALAPWLPAAFAQAGDWRGVRATSPDRLPIVGPWPVNDFAPIWLCTALGARGITLGLLCAELLVAQLHKDPLPVAPKLAESLQTGRIARRLLVVSR